MVPQRVSDWRLDLKNDVAIAFPDDGRGAAIPEGDALAFSKKLITHMRQLSRESGETFRPQFSFTIDELKFRAQYLDSEIYALRRIEAINRSTEELGLHPLILEELLAQKHEAGGLILTAGPTGSGKTTSTTTIVKKRLEILGGYCLAIEDPKEFEISGFHGSNGGFCNQIEASGPEDYKQRVIQALRCFPAKSRGLLYLGEIRERVTATEACRAALSGLLCMSTIHAHNPISAIQRMLAYMGGEDSPDTRSLLADAISVIVFQKFDEDGRLDAVWLPRTDKIKAAIKSGKLDGLIDDISQQKSLMRRYVK